MAGKFLSMDEAASQLGISAEHLRQLTQKYEVNGLRDGASFKYKPEEIERAKAKLFPAKGNTEDSGDLTDLPIDLAADDDGDDIVLLSEVELGESGPGTSATVIGPAGGRAAQEGSDISIFAQDSDLQLTKPMPAKPGSDLLLGGASDLGLDLGSALNLSPPAKGGADSGINLSAMDDDEDDLVLHGPGASDITLSPGDSGISLASPADSGLSLDGPLDLKTGSSGKDFDLAGDDLTLDEGSSAKLVADDEFLLTPSADGGDDDDASGSQVIVIDSDSADFTDGGMLEEDTSGGLTPVGAMPTESFGMASAGSEQAAAPVMREAGYSGLQIVSLSFCVLFLCLCGMMMIDITRNMWAWNSEMGVNSAMADAILGIFGG